MEMLGLILPIFAIMVTGFVFRLLRIVPEGLADGLIQFAFYVAVPALLILVIGRSRSPSWRGGACTPASGVRSRPCS